MVPKNQPRAAHAAPGTYNAFELTHANAQTPKTRRVDTATTTSLEPIAENRPTRQLDSYEVPVAGVVYGVMVTSRCAKGRVVSIDAAAAEKHPGVVAVLTPYNAIKLPGGTKPKAGVCPKGRMVASRAGRSMAMASA